MKLPFLLKFIGSMALAALSAVALSYDFLSFALVLIVVAYAFCPVRKHKGVQS